MNQKDNILPDGYRTTELGPLPEEWRVVRLGEAIRAIKGRKPATIVETPTKDSLPYLTAEYFRSAVAHQFTPKEALGNVEICEADDVVLIWDGSKAGQVFTGLRGVLASTMVKLESVIEGLDKVVLYFFLLSHFETLNSRTTGSTIPHVSKSVLLNLPIPLPPLPEQRAIAHVLRAVQRAREATERVIAATRELKKSLMRHLFTYGPVPVDQADQVPMQETDIGPIPAHWRVVRLGDVAEIKGGKRLPKGQSFSEFPTKYPYIRVVDLQNGSVNIAGLKYLTEMQHRILKRYCISKSDIYISIAGTIGLVGRVPDELDGAHLTENAAKLVLNSPRVDQAYLVFFLSSEQGQNQIHQRTTKTSQPKLALSRITGISIPLPPLFEQREIARILQAVDRKIEAEEARKQALEALFKTLLHQLMTGKLRVVGLLSENPEGPP